MNLEDLAFEVSTYVSDIDVTQDGERIFSNYQKVTAYSLRLMEIHNQISMLEIMGQASQELRKFRTMIVDPTLEEFKKIQSYESRKITAMQLELSLQEKG